MKMIQVEDKAHEQAKKQAKEAGMLLKYYIAKLIEKDAEVNK